tara:strand:+ start:404 stop:865 length:462 start_codon:yes stop_codon:yes gene_type:complete
MTNVANLYGVIYFYQCLSLSAINKNFPKLGYISVERNRLRIIQPKQNTTLLETYKKKDAIINRLATPEEAAEWREKENAWLKYRSSSSYPRSTRDKLYDIYVATPRADMEMKKNKEFKRLVSISAVLIVTILLWAAMAVWALSWIAIINLIMR